jgi:hypothetical protein
LPSPVITDFGNNNESSAPNRQTFLEIDDAPLHNAMYIGETMFWLAPVINVFMGISLDTLRH